MELANNNDPQIVFQELFKQYYAPFCLYASRFVADNDICKDIVSDVFAMLWDKKEDFELREDTTLAYIKICVKNSCLNFLKHKNYESDYKSEVQYTAPLYADNSDCIYTLEEMYQMLYETLEKLPPQYREVFTKSFFEGKNRTEIAEEMNISVKTVNRYKQKALELLKFEFKDCMALLLFLSIL